ncbi:unnamed protein product [Ilex paraguariensis]|uniref:Uncharacterized protein n=1 Tax=Ilex paraguariensis TaxID=185542 RepID=A0ABC8RZJ7_9AQUA
MATIVASRAASMEKTTSFFRLSFNFFRNFSSSTTTINTTTSAASVGTKNSKRKNLFEVVQFLPNWGIGYQMAKTHWIGVSYQITRINLYRDGRHGKAWGIVHKDGYAHGHMEHIA